MAKIYGYVRVSTKKQNESRQTANIKDKYPEAIIYTDKFTGTKMDRPAWNRLQGKIKAGDTIVFDEVSRMSRNAEEGFATYKDLYEKGITLVFLKESTLNTENFRQTEQIARTGNWIADAYIETTNRVLMQLAENQIKAAFETAEHEVDFLHKRVAEGVRRAQAAGKQVGLEQGRTLTTKKSIEAKKQIRKYSKTFDGTLKDTEVIKLIGISNNSYYKYKRELIEEITEMEG